MAYYASLMILISSFVYLCCLQTIIVQGPPIRLAGKYIVDCFDCCRMACCRWMETQPIPKHCLHRAATKNRGIGFGWGWWTDVRMRNWGQYPRTHCVFYRLLRQHYCSLSSEDTRKPNMLPWQWACQKETPSSQRAPSEAEGSINWTGKSNCLMMDPLVQNPWC